MKKHSILSGKALARLGSLSLLRGRQNLHVALFFFNAVVTTMVFLVRGQLLFSCCRNEGDDCGTCCLLVIALELLMHRPVRVWLLLSSKLPVL